MDGYNLFLFSKCKITINAYRVDGNELKIPAHLLPKKEAAVVRINIIILTIIPLIKIIGNPEELLILTLLFFLNNNFIIKMFNI